MTFKKSFNKGSEWRKWDLHVHTPKSFLANNYGKCTIDDFVAEIVNNNLAAIGLTNYFRFNDGELEEIKEKLNNKGVVVFPNLEFRTQPQNKENEEMHVHVVFSDKISKAKIEGFLGRLKTVDDKYCKDLTEQEIKTTSVTFDSLKTALEQDKGVKYLEDYILVACPRGDGSYRPSEEDDGRGNNLAVTIDKKSDALFGKKDDTQFFLKKDRYKESQPKPVFYCSDSHKKTDIGTGFTWIKADLTFEGLKQTLYEPADRVKIQERDPGDSKSLRVSIAKAVYKDSSGNKKTITFNKDLNSIIGVRGSGKSTLLRNLAQKIDQDQFFEKDRKSPYPLKDFEVTWGDGQKNDGTDESPKSVFYIPQGYLSAIAYDDGENVAQRDAFLTKLLKKNTRFANAIQSYENFVSKNQVKIEEIIQKLLRADSTVKEGEKSLKKQGSKAEIEAEIKTKNAQIKKYKDTTGSGITDKQIESYSKAQQLISTSKKTVEVLEQDQEILNTLKKSGANIFISDQEFNMLSSERQQLIQNELSKKSKDSLKSLIESEVQKIKKLTTSHKKVIAEQTKIAKELEDKIKNSKALEDLTKELGVLQETLDKIIELSKRISKAKQTRTDAVNELVSTYAEFESQQEMIYKTIKFDEKFSFLQIEVISRYNISQLETFVDRNINTRDSDTALKNDEEIKVLFGGNPTQLTNDTVKKVIEGIIDGRIRIKVDTGGDTAAVLSQFLRNRYEIDYLNSVKTLEGVHFKDMTGGQKAIALLELVFRFDDENYPILIDQPEDDLDVSGVATDLVNFVKTEKIERQIILVTHNASLVVCSDTENVISSDTKRVGNGKYDFSYKTGSIENPDRRDDIVRVLEGGNEALRKRMQKLNIR